MKKPKARSRLSPKSDLLRVEASEGVISEATFGGQTLPAGAVPLIDLALRAGELAAALRMAADQCPVDPTKRAPLDLAGTAAGRASAILWGLAGDAVGEWLAPVRLHEAER